MIENETNQV